MEELNLCHAFRRAVDPNAVVPSAYLMITISFIVQLGSTVGLSCVPYRASLKKQELINGEGDIKDETLETV